MTRGFIPIALLSAGLLAFGLQPAPAAGSSNSPGPDVAKLDGGLRILAEAAESGRPVTSQTGMDAGNGVKVLAGARVDHGDVLVNVYVDGSVADAASALQGLGMRISATNDRAPQRLVAGWLPATKLLDATALTATKAILTVHTGMDGADGTDTGTVLSQGDAAHHGPQARALGTTGAGVKVGVISDSINRVAGGVAASQATGNLPASVTVLQDDPTPGTIDEGRAMAEIIYDEAPGITEMYFSTGTVGGAAGKAASINNLVAQGVKVIADDIFLIDEPMFQDGVVAQAVDAAKAAGVSYFASAGNRARQSWEGTLTGTDNDFDPGAGIDPIQTLGNFSGVSPFISLQWAEPWGAATTDLRLDWYVDGNPVASNDDDNIATGFPVEVEQLGLPAGSHSVAIGIHRDAGAGTPFMKYIAGGAGTFTVAEFPTNSNAINPDAASAAGSLAVAASNWATPTTPEAFSSRGPSITRLFTAAGVPQAPVVRLKPALAAADGVSTTVPALLTFFGTSAATPSAAGIATLIRAAAPALTPNQVAAIMTDTGNTQACLTAAPATDCGAGFIMADLAVQDTGIGTVTTATPTVTAASPAGPSSSTTPAITGTAEAGSTVTLYGTNTCAGPALGSGTAVAFQGSGITATVPANATTTVFAKATKFSQSDSACSSTSVSYTNDSAAPDTTITSTFPGGVAKSLTVPIDFTSTEAGSSFQCALDSGAFASCTSGQALTLASGPHSVTVKATDPAGNTDASPASVTFSAYDCPTLNAAAQAAASQVTTAQTKVAKAKKALKKAKKTHNATKIKKAKKKLKKAKAELKTAQAAATAAQQAAAPCAT